MGTIKKMDSEMLLEELGNNNSDRSYLNQAIDAYNDSLKVYKSDQQPLQWATVKYETRDRIRLSWPARTRHQVSTAGRTELSPGACGIPGWRSARICAREIQDGLKIALDEFASARME